MSGMELGKRLNKGKCLIIGDAMIDTYIYGSVKRISPEAPIPVVNVKEISVGLGGAANVASNIESLGGNAWLYTVIGNDENAKKLKRLLREQNVSDETIKSLKRRTTCKTRVIGKGQQIVRYDEETTEPLSLEDEAKLLDIPSDFIDENTIVVISDYAKGVCTQTICKKIIDLARVKMVKVIVDPKGNDWSKYANAYLVTPNWSEFVEIVGEVDDRDETEISKRAHDLMDRYQIANLLITRSEKGMTLVSKEKCTTICTEAREVADVSGAGDTVIAAVATFLAANFELDKAVILANMAAGIAVEKRGTSVVTLAELEKRYIKSKTNFVGDYRKKIVLRADIEKMIQRVRQSGQVIVFTNGCFDILHAGHLQYLNEAKQLGDFLVVGLNSDASVRKLGKGDMRPIINQNDRAEQLAALQMVDAVVIFDEETPYELLQTIQPDILVKGGDYRIEDIVGREFAKEVQVLSFKKGYSTTSIIQKICESNE